MVFFQPIHPGLRAAGKFPAHLVRTRVAEYDFVEDAHLAVDDLAQDARGWIDVEIERPTKGKPRIIRHRLDVRSVKGVVHASRGQVLKAGPELLAVDTLIEFA